MYHKLEQSYLDVLSRYLTQDQLTYSPVNRYALCQIDQRGQRAMSIIQQAV